MYHQEDEPDETGGGCVERKRMDSRINRKSRIEFTVMESLQKRVYIYENIVRLEQKIYEPYIRINL